MRSDIVLLRRTLHRIIIPLRRPPRTRLLEKDAAYTDSYQNQSRPLARSHQPWHGNEGFHVIMGQVRGIKVSDVVEHAGRQDGFYSTPWRGSNG